MPNAAVERTSPAAGGKHSVVVAALGDALANTHFYSGGGMSTGMCLNNYNYVCVGSFFESLAILNRYIQYTIQFTFLVLEEKKYASGA
jgi:hypothetical protein